MGYYKYIIGSNFLFWNPAKIQRPGPFFKRTTREHYYLHDCYCIEDYVGRLRENKRKRTPPPVIIIIRIIITVDARYCVSLEENYIQSELPSGKSTTRFRSSYNFETGALSPSRNTIGKRRATTGRRRSRWSLRWAVRRRVCGNSRTSNSNKRRIIPVTSEQRLVYFFKVGV